MPWTVAVVYQGLHGPAGVVVKGEGGAHDPHDLLPCSFSWRSSSYQPVIIPGIGGLAGAALPEDELVPLPVALFLGSRRQCR